VNLPSPDFYRGDRISTPVDIGVGINLEFIRSEDKPFRFGVAKAAELGYRFVEPMVHNGRELLSEAGYFHSFSMDNEPLEMKDILEEYGVAASGLSAHSPLMRPEISVPYLEKAVRLAAVIGAPVVNTDEGIRPAWMEDEDCFHVMKYTLTKVLQVAERYGVQIGIEPHQSITRTTQGLLRVAGLVDSPFLRINYDTGNALLGGEEPYEGLTAVLPLLAHVHAKDISLYQAETEQGKVTGTPVGCGCGEGLVDWVKIVEILRAGNYRGVLSVECGTSAQAASSFRHLSEILVRQPAVQRV